MRSEDSRVRHDGGSAADLEGLEEALAADVREIDDHSELVAAPDKLPTEGSQAGAGVGTEALTAAVLERVG